MEKKKIKKSIESLEKQKQEHREKIEDYGGKNYPEQKRKLPSSEGSKEQSSLFRSVSPKPEQTPHFSVEYKTEGFGDALLSYRKQNKTNFIFCPVNSFNHTKSFRYWEKEINSFENKIEELKKRLEEKR